MSERGRARASGPKLWTTPLAIEKKVRRTWDSGALLRAFGGDEPFPIIDMKLRGPSARDLGEHYEHAREWVAEIERASGRGRNFRITGTTVGGRHMGRSTIPGRAVIETYEQAWNILRVGAEAARFENLLAEAGGVSAPAREWALARPIRALQVADDWAGLLAALEWLNAHRGSRRYLREIDVAGVDTKLVERNRGVLAEILGVAASRAEFLIDLGLADKPQSVRMRFDPHVFGFPPKISEATLRVEELSTLEVRADTALIIENEITYLSVPVPQRGVVIWGRGYDASTAAALPWLGDLDAAGAVRYWGDLDTHGFAILNRVRNYLPNVESVLMDRATLIEHREMWGSEPVPKRADLPLLTAEETEVYAALVADEYGPALRLEQERLNWAWVLERLGVSGAA